MARELHKAGKEIVIHLPLQAVKDVPREPVTLLTDMPAEEMRALVCQAVKDVPFAKGVSNHQGSRFIADSSAVDKLTEALAEMNLYFIDNLTSPHTVAYEICGSKNIPALKRDVFLDCDLKPDETFTQRFEQLVKIAQIRGYAVGVGHCRWETLNALRLFLDSPAAAEVEFVFPSQLLDEKGGGID